MTNFADLQAQMERAAELRDRGQRADAFKAFLDIYQNLPAGDAGTRGPRAEVLVNLGALVRDSGDPASAIPFFERVATELSDVHEWAIAAQYNRASALMALGRSDEALAGFDETLACARTGGRNADASVRAAVAGAHLNRGVLLAQQGQVDAAIASCDEAARCYAREVDPAAQGDAAHALYNKAVVLRDADRRAEAIAAFDDVVARFGGSANGLAQHWAAIALYNKSIQLARAGEIPASLSAVEDLVRRFGGSKDDAVRERMAKGLYSAVLLLRRGGRVVESVRVCQDLQVRFAGEANAVVQNIVAAARRHDLFVVAAANPSLEASTTGVADLNPAVRLALQDVGHLVAGVANVIWDGPDSPAPALTLADIAAVTGAIAPPAPPDDARKARTRAVLARPGVQQQLERDLKGHFEAAKILMASLDQGEPFGVFLRNFDVEGFTQAGHGPPAPIRVNAQLAREGRIEQRVVTSLEPRLRTIGLGNNATLRPDFTHHLPRLLLPNEHWREVMAELLKAAAAIVLDVVRLTPGVRLELEMIAELGRTDDTVVILSAPHPDEAGLAAATALYGVGPPDIEAARLGDPAFSSFAHVVSELELHDSLIETPVFHAVLAKVHALRQLDPDERARWDRVVF